MSEPLIEKIILIARQKPISPMQVSKLFEPLYTQDYVFTLIDKMQNKGLVYFDVETDTLLVLNDIV